MPRNRPVRLNAAPRAQARPPAKSGRGNGRRPSRRQQDNGGGSAPYWIAVILIVLIVSILAAFWEVPQLRSIWSKPSEETMEGPLPSQAPQETQEAAQQKAKRDAEARWLAWKKKHQKKLVELKLTAPTVQPPPDLAPESGTPQVPVVPPTPAPPPTQAAPAPAPQPAPAIQPGAPTVYAPPAPKPGEAPRAMPVSDALTTERVAAYQVALERIHFSCGFVDGNQGMRTQRMLRAFQSSRGLPQTGFLDQATRQAIGEPGEPFLTYTVTPADVASIMPKPQTWKDKARAKRLGYNDMWEMLGEKFHCTRGYLRQLNPDVSQPVAGSEIIGPKVYPTAPYPHAASLRVNLGQTSIEALDADGRIVAFFPCSIAKDKNKRPNGKLVVRSVVPDPDYTFDPALFADASKAEGITHKLLLPPGPRNPVGTAWIGLSLPGYGIHGTPEPENISRTQSHGCFRLANWNAEKVLKMVRVGTPVDVQP